MNNILAASFCLLALLAAPAAQAKCEKGEVSSGGLCIPCNDNQYVAGGRCRTCAEGFTTTAARTGCKKLPASSGGCKEKGTAMQGGMCMPCGNQQYVMKNQCRSCPKGFTTNPARSGCTKVVEPKAQKCKNKGEATVGGMPCFPCGEEQYVAGGFCRDCPKGFTTTKARTGCKKK